MQDGSKSDWLQTVISVGGCLKYMPPPKHPVEISPAFKCIDDVITLSYACLRSERQAVDLRHEPVLESDVRHAIVTEIATAACLIMKDMYLTNC
jgi:hypothetical protein